MWLPLTGSSVSCLLCFPLSYGHLCSAFGTVASSRMLPTEKLREVAVRCTPSEVVELTFVWTMSHAKVRAMPDQKCFQAVSFVFPRGEASRMTTGGWFGKCTSCCCNFSNYEKEQHTAASGMLQSERHNVMRSRLLLYVLWSQSKDCSHQFIVTEY